MIVTLTGNLLAERTFEFPAWEPGRTQRAARESFQVGGKGINVSRVLARLGARTVALCFAGGATGEECLRWLNEHERGVDCRAFRSGTATRAGFVVVAEGRERTETTFLGPDVAPDEASLAACAAWLDAEPAGHALAFCGSFPGWETPAAAPLREAISRRIARGGGNVYVDTYGAPLAWFVEKPVALVKINRAEFDRLAREAGAGDSALAPENPMPARLDAARRRWPAARNWVVTDGPRPVWHAADGGAPASHQPPAIREVSPTGAGDVLFACILHGLVGRHFALAEAVGKAIPFATTKAAGSGLPGQHS